VVKFRGFSRFSFIFVASSLEKDLGKSKESLKVAALFPTRFNPSEAHLNFLISKTIFISFIPPNYSRNLSPASHDTSSQNVGSRQQMQRPTSPSPSLANEQPKGKRTQQNPQPTSTQSPMKSILDPAELAERHKIEEEERKKRIQLYVFVSRCVSYPFNSKQPNDMTKRQQKITKQNLDTITNRFQAFMKGETQIMADEAFQNAVQSYHDVFLKSDRVQKMVASGACSQHDFREVFRNNIEKRVRSLPEIDGLSKETVLTSWMAKFDCILKGTGDDEHKRPTRMQPLNSESILTKEQLFDMFQQILGVKKFEHQILFNALMVSWDFRYRRDKNWAQQIDFCCSE
jgi:calcium-dependent secretion activator